LSEAGIDRDCVYVTNAIKHFKFEQRGKRRIHQKPTMGEVKHYRWWLDQELRLVHPKLVVALGATAVLALAGKPLPIARFRGPADFHGRAGFITVHPSYLLRLPERSAKEQQFREFVSDLKNIRKLATSPLPSRSTGALR
jgi:DNA polymerase